MFGRDLNEDFAAPICRYYNIPYRCKQSIEDIMISIAMVTPQEMLKNIAEKARGKRLTLDLSQKTLAEKSGVSYGVLKKFEHTGQIYLASLLKLALVLGSLNDFAGIFAPHKPEQVLSLDDLIKTSNRKRGRQ